MSRRGLVAIAVAVILVVAAAVLAEAHRSQARARSDYLALGDSISYGLREPDTVPTPVYSDPARFTGFPEDVGAALGMRVANAACSGETSLELLRTDTSVLACALHVQYAGTQIQYATAYLKSHPNTTLVTLMIGINDTLKCQQATSDNCVRQLPRILARLSLDVATTLKELRSSYNGTIVIVNYYPLVYAGVDNSPDVNRTVDRAASRYHVKVADGWRAFETAAAGSSGNLCAAGLLTQLVGDGCGIHPSLAGQALLALAVEEAVQNFRPPAESQLPPCTVESARRATECASG
jgi:lysophospholipase L1-like esterase